MTNAKSEDFFMLLSLIRDGRNFYLKQDNKKTVKPFCSNGGSGKTCTTTKKAHGKTASVPLTLVVHLKFTRFPFTKEKRKRLFICL